MVSVKHVDMDRLYEAALPLLRAGCSILPLQHKIPSIKGWKQLQVAAPTEEEVRRWFSGSRKSNVTGIGVILGKVSGGLVVRDFDIPNAFELWASQHSLIARSLPVSKTSRGHHVFFRNLETKTTKLADGEIRGEGSYVVVPPSRHPDGCEYQWLQPFPGQVRQISEVDLNIFEEEHKSEVAVPLQDSKTTIQKDKEYVCGSPRHEGEVLSEIDLTPFIPQKQGERDRCLWELAIKVKKLAPDVTPADLTPLFKCWYQRAEQKIGTKGENQNLIEFLRKIELVRNDEGVWMEEALQVAKDCPLANVNGPLFQRLAAFAWGLSRLANGEIFTLSSRMGGKAINQSPPSALKALTLLVKYGWLESIDRGYRGVHGEAAKYRFVGPGRALP